MLTWIDFSPLVWQQTSEKLVNLQMQGVAILLARIAANGEILSGL